MIGIDRKDNAVLRKIWEDYKTGKGIYGVPGMPPIPITDKKVSKEYIEKLSEIENMFNYIETLSEDDNEIQLKE